MTNPPVILDRSECEVLQRVLTQPQAKWELGDGPVVKAVLHRINFYLTGLNKRNT